MKKFKTILTILLSVSISGFSQKYELNSPNKQLSVSINSKEKISFSLHYKEQVILNVLDIALQLNNIGILGSQPKVINVTRKSVNEQIITPFYVKSSKINDKFNALILHFKNDFSIEFRAYNDGLAYRFISEIDKDIVVNSEIMDFQVDENTFVYFPEETSLISH